MKCKKRQSLDKYIEKHDIDNKWGKLAIKTLPILLRCAKDKKTISYTRLNEIWQEKEYSEVNYKGSALIHLGRPAAIIGNYFLNHGWAPLNALLVGKSTGVPGKGGNSFIESYIKSKNMRKHIGKYKKYTPSKKKVFLQNEIWNELYDNENLKHIMKANCIERLKKFEI